MNKRLMGVFGATLLLFSMTVVALAQTPTTPVTTTQTVQNSDGTYTIVEYPVGRETTVTLNPVGLSGATGRATVLRAANGTTIKLNLTGLPAEATAVNVYAVDPTGAVTSLGPVQIASGAGTFTTTTPMTRFMLIASPDAQLSAYNDSSLVYFRSAAPTGLALIPITNAAGETVAAVATPATPEVMVKTPADVAVVANTSDYTVPMIGIGNFRKGDDTKLKIDFTGEMEGARANVFIEPHKNGRISEVRMRFHDLKEAPKGTAFVLWAESTDGQFARLGQVINVKGRNEAEIKSEVSFEDFGLLMTTEDLNAQPGAVVRPAGHRVGIIRFVP